MLIQICIQWFQPAYKAGGPIQSIANLVNSFSEDISYKIICSNSDLDGSLLPVSTNTWIKYNQDAEVLYVSKKKSTISILKKEIQGNNPILFINGLYSWRFNLAPLLFANGIRKIVSARGMLHPGALSQKSFKKNIYIGLWKFLGLHKRCDFHASTEDEKVFIQNAFGTNVKVFIAQNFPRVFNIQMASQKKTGLLKLVSIALISPMKNHLIILKALIACKCDIQYNIYGPIKDQNYWQECTQLIQKMPTNIKVKYHGDIPPDKVESTLEKSDIFILPSKSENFGHAIFEALTAGKPVITSMHTPWNNLRESNAGVNVDVNKIEEISNAIDFFARLNHEEFMQWNLGAKEYSSSEINIEEIKEQYKNMFFA